MMSKTRAKGPHQQTLHSFSRQLPSFEEFNDIQADLIESSNRTVAVAASSIVELCLEKLLISALPRSRHVIDQLNGRDGALGGFYSKNYLGYAMALYGGGDLTQLETIRRIRNAFAHSGRPIKFTTPLVAKECTKLTIGKSSREEWPSSLSKERIAFTAACISFMKKFLAMTILVKIRGIATKLPPDQINAILARWEDHPLYSDLVVMFRKSS